MIKGIYVIIDLGIINQRRIERIVRDVAEGGANLIQLRGKVTSTKELLEAGIKLRPICKKKNIPLIINDRIDVALALDADGVHLGQDDMPASFAKNLLSKAKMIGVSTHSLEEAKKAEMQRVGYIGVGPIFSTKTKEKAGPPVGEDLIREIKKNVKLPVVGIGGINLRNMRGVIQAGADAIAVCSAILCSADIKASTEQFLLRFHKSRNLH